jgi:hypothetical protein
MGPTLLPWYSRVSHGLTITIRCAQQAFIRIDAHENCWWRVGSSWDRAAGRLARQAAKVCTKKHLEMELSKSQ